MKSPVRIGTRGSRLALYQTELVISLLKARFPEIQFEMVQIKTSGDAISQEPAAVGHRIFTSEIEDALLSGRIDIGVHSAKDLSPDLPNGLLISSALEREDPRDCFISKDSVPFMKIRKNGIIGTSSLRRSAQIRHLRRDVQVSVIRGNVETRLKKLKEGTFDGIVMAYAGLKRIGLAAEVTEIFNVESFLPHAGQGIICLEVRAQDRSIIEITNSINHQQTFYMLIAERAALRRLQGGCQVPIGIYATLTGDKIFLSGAIYALDGVHVVSAENSGCLFESEQVGETLAKFLLEKGGKELLSSIRTDLARSL